MLFLFMAGSIITHIAAASFWLVSRLWSNNVEIQFSIILLAEKMASWEIDRADKFMRFFRFAVFRRPFWFMCNFVFFSRRNTWILHLDSNSATFQHCEVLFWEWLYGSQILMIMHSHKTPNETWEHPRCRALRRFAWKHFSYCFARGLRVVVLGYKSSFNFMAERANKVWGGLSQQRRLDFLR